MVKSIKKILFGYGIKSLDKKGFKLVKKVLRDEENTSLGLEEIEEEKKIYDTDLGFELDKKLLMDYIECYGIGNIYVGERVGHYSNGELNLRNMHGEEMLLKSGYSCKKSLFKHDENDYYYYDLLDNNKRCEHINPGVFYIRDGCDNMKSIASILDKPKEKVRRG